MSQGPDVCLDCPESAFKKFYPHYFRGFDKWGRPVLYDQVVSPREGRSGGTMAQTEPDTTMAGY